MFISSLLQVVVGLGHFQHLHQFLPVVHGADLLAQQHVQQLADGEGLSGKVRSMKNLVSTMVLAPTASPWREHSAWGTISPKMTMPNGGGDHRAQT